MRITIEHNDTKIEIEEAPDGGKDRLVSMSWEGQNKAIQETIKVMCEQILRLQGTESE